MISIRTCIACRQKFPQAELLRLVIGDTPQIDPTHHQSGRGVYLCKKTTCVERLIKNKKSWPHFFGIKEIPQNFLDELQALCTNSTKTNDQP